jgi:ASPM-SPD-2-Hydin domain-containing protein/HYDIN/CFA65/VesB family protein
VNRPPFPVSIASSVWMAILLCGAAFAGTLDLPTVEISATTLAFGNQVVESRSAPQKVLLLNRGTAPLAIRKIAASGDFGVESDCGATLEAGHGCTIVTTFSPSLTGDTDGKLTIEDDSKASPHVVTLTGSGVLPLTITPATLLFDPRTVGTSQTAFVTVTNNQSERISALQIAVGQGFAQSSNCASGIPAGKSCEVRITFTPTEAKQVRGKITLQYGSKAQVLMATGTAVAPAPPVTGLRVRSPRIPAVAALAPIIPPTPNISDVRVASRKLPAATRAAVIPPAPPVNTVVPVTRRAPQTAAAPEVISPPPTISSSLGSARRVAQATPGVIEPAPLVSASLGSRGVPKDTYAAPSVIAPAPTTSSLRQNARVRTPTSDVTVRPAPPVEAAKPSPTQVASVKPPAETTAVRAIAEGAAAAPPPVPVPIVKPSPQPVIETARPVAMASVPPRATAAAGPRVKLIIGLKGTAVGTVVSSSGGINCGSACQDSFLTGQKVILTPQSTANTSFAGWRGCDSVSGSNCTVVMDRDKTVTAIFVKHYDDLSPE